MTDKPVRKAGRNSGGNWKKPKPRKKDPWKLCGGWMNNIMISPTTVTLSKGTSWAQAMSRGERDDQRNAP